VGRSSAECFTSRPSSLLVSHFASIKLKLKLAAHGNVQVVDRQSARTPAMTCPTRSALPRALTNRASVARQKKNAKKLRKFGPNTLFDLDEWLLFIE
jgi:hypothetical protein